jgi:hypothetical protein
VPVYNRWRKREHILQIDAPRGRVLGYDRHPGTVLARRQQQHCHRCYIINPAALIKAKTFCCRTLGDSWVLLPTDDRRRFLATSSSYGSLGQECSNGFAFRGVYVE